MKNSMEAPYKTKNKAAIWSNNPTHGYIFRENHNSKNTGTPMFIAAFIAKTWKQAKCTMPDELRKCGTYIWWSFSHKTEWNTATCRNMDATRNYHTKWSKSEKDKYCMILHICGI